MKTVYISIGSLTQGQLDKELVSPNLYSVPWPYRGALLSKDKTVVMGKDY